MRYYTLTVQKDRLQIGSVTILCLNTTPNSADLEIESPPGVSVRCGELEDAEDQTRRVGDRGSLALAVASAGQQR